MKYGKNIKIKNDMDILMIGHSRSGKTSYMAALYKEYGENSGGYGITTTTSERERLSVLANNIAKGYYPKGTDIASEYEFWLKIDNKKIIPFNWYDYRGGVLSENSKNSAEARMLIQKIEDADALIVFLDGEKIKSETNEDLEDDYDTILWAIQKAISAKNLNNCVFPISFVVTKGDYFGFGDPIMIQNGQKYYNPDFKGLDYFIPFFDTIGKNKKIQGLLCKCTIFNSCIYNVFPPLITSLYFGMNSYINKRIDIHNQEVERYNNYNPNVVDDVWTWLFGGDSQRELAEKSLKKIKKEKENFTFLQSKRDDMWNIIEKMRNDNQIYLF